MIGIVNILFAHVSSILPLWLTWLLRMHEYIYWFCAKSKGLRVFFLPFFYVSPPIEYLSLRFKRNRLKIFGHLIAVYTCMLGENHQKNRTMARFRLNIKKKQKYTPHSGKQECVSIYQSNSNLRLCLFKRESKIKQSKSLDH